MIKGIYADEADKLHPDGHLKVRRATTHPCPQQWVNVYEIDVCGRAIYYDSCQVKDLNLDDPEEYGLEPTDEYGNLMSLKEAFSLVDRKYLTETALGKLEIKVESNIYGSSLS